MTTATQPKLKALKGGKQSFRTVEVVRRVEHDRWDLVEAVEQDIVSRLGREAIALAHARPSGVHTGLYAVCDEIADAVRAEGTEPLKRESIARFFVVSQAWPREARVKGASYGAHERLFARGDRVARLQNLVDRASDGRVNRNDVDRWLADQKPRKFIGFLDGIERGVRAVLKAKGKPWTKVADDDRQEIARMLRTIANEIENGEFA